MASTLEDDGRSRNQDLDERTIFFLAPGLKRKFLSVLDALADPGGFGVAVRRNDQAVKSFPGRFGGRETEQAGELAINAEDAVLFIDNADGFGSVLDYLLEISLFDR